MTYHESSQYQEAVGTISLDMLIEELEDALETQIPLSYLYTTKGDFANVTIFDLDDTHVKFRAATNLIEEIYDESGLCNQIIKEAMVEVILRLDLIDTIYKVHFEI